MLAITFNLNRKATVKLSKKGYEHLKSFQRKHGGTYGKLQSDNETFIAQVWELMEIFGHMIYHGAEMSPFVGNEMTVDLDD